MEKLFITAEKKGSTFSQYRLYLPSSKQPVPLPSSGPARYEEERRRRNISEDKRSINWVITGAVHCRKGPSHKMPSSYDPIDPINKTGALNFLYSKHPFPLCQGPVIIPIEEDYYWDKEKKEVISTKEVVFENRTVFTHANTQQCFEWLPILTGNNA